MRLKLFTFALVSLLGLSAYAQTYNVTFRVDMAGVTDPYTTPEVNGDFNGWCGGCAPMTNTGGTIWELTIPLAAGPYQYKFAADTWTIQETLTPGSDCTFTDGAFTNRTLNVYQDVTLDVAAWGVGACLQPAAPTFDITFVVDMAGVTDPYTTPEVNGDFNGWCGGCAPMTNTGGDIWELTIALAPGDYQFKFAADTWTIQEELTPGSPCTFTEGAFTNRTLTVTEDQTLATATWGVGECLQTPPALYDVTFTVDMSDVTDPYTTPEVNGNFNGWCGGCAPMTNIGGDVWSLVIALPAGDYEYKFAADSWTIQEDLTGVTGCTVMADGFTNRAVSVVDANVDLGTVCWASCDACGAVANCSAETLVTGMVATPTGSGMGVALAWDALPGADLYQAKGRVLGTIPLGQFVTSNNFKNVGGLIPATEYEWRLRARCGEGGPITPFTQFESFTTEGIPLKIAEQNSDLTVFPTITSDQLNIAFGMETAEQVRVSITDITGQLLSEETLTSNPGLNQLTKSVNNLNPGIYFLNVTNDFQVRTSKFIVQ